MGLFSFFNRKNGKINGIDTEKLPAIPENVFVEKEGYQENSNEDKLSSESSDNGINVLFRFLEKSHESKGYDDALINPDSTHLDQNIEALKSDLRRIINKQKIFYQDFIREINFHISSRQRSGMVDTVEELAVKKETAAAPRISVNNLRAAVLVCTCPAFCDFSSKSFAIFSAKVLLPALRRFSA